MGFKNSVYVKFYINFSWGKLEKINTTIAYCEYNNLEFTNPHIIVTTAISTVVTGLTTETTITPTTTDASASERMQ